MLSTLFIFLLFLGFALNPVFASSDESFKGSMTVTGRIGMHSLAATHDPFDTLPIPLGASFEFFLTDRLGIGSTVMYDEWRDYLGLYGGKYTFRVFRPSLDLIYHLRFGKMEGLDIFSGGRLGYNILSVSNEIGNDYKGELHSAAHIEPFLGARLRFFKNRSGLLGRLLLAVEVSWSVTGHYSGVNGAVGIGCRIR